jgi:uncharacterized membrane protein
MKLMDKKPCYFIIIYNTFICFLIYSFIGWLIETVCMSVSHGYLVKRGFLISPICGIYGVGTLLVVTLVNRIKSHPILVFFSSMFITTALELLTGMIMENLLKRELWDYSKRAFNFLGVICLRNTLFWGVMCLIIVYFIHPRIIEKVRLIPLHIKESLCNVFFVFISLDLAVSIHTSIIGINNIDWVSGLLLHRLKLLEVVTVKVVYFISH